MIEIPCTQQFLTIEQMIQLNFCQTFLHTFAYCDKTFLEQTIAPRSTGDYRFNINNAHVFCEDEHVHTVIVSLIMHHSV